MISINLFNLNFRTDSIPSQDAAHELEEKKDITKLITAIALTILCGIGVYFIARHTNLSAHSLSQVNLCSGTIRIITQLAQAVFQIFMNEALKTVVKMAISFIAIYFVAKVIANWRLNIAEQLVEEGKPSQALVALRKIPGSYKNSSRALRLEVLTHMLLGNAAKVRHSSTLLDKQIEKTDHDDVILSLSHLFSGNLAYSIDFANRAKYKNNKNPSAWMLLAGQNLLLGDFRSVHTLSNYAMSLLHEKVNGVELERKISAVQRQRDELTKIKAGVPFFLRKKLLTISKFFRRLLFRDPKRDIQAIIPNQFLQVFGSYKKLYYDICCGKIQSRMAIEADPRFSELSQFSKLNLLSSFYHKKGQLNLALNLLNESMGFIPFSSCLFFKKTIIEYEMNNKFEENEIIHALMKDFDISRSSVYRFFSWFGHLKYYKKGRAVTINYHISNIINREFDKTPEDQILEIMKLVFLTL